MPQPIPAGPPPITAAFPLFVTAGAVRLSCQGIISVFCRDQFHAADVDGLFIEVTGTFIHTRMRTDRSCNERKRFFSVMTFIASSYLPALQAVSTPGYPDGSDNLLYTAPQSSQGAAPVSSSFSTEAVLLPLRDAGFSLLHLQSLRTAFGSSLRRRHFPFPEVIPSGTFCHIRPALTVSSPRSPARCLRQRFL